MRQKHEIELHYLRVENATFREQLATHHPPPPTSSHSSSYQTPTHVETRHNDNHTQFSSHNTQKETPIHSRLRTLTLNNDAVRLHPFVNGFMDIPLPITWKSLNIEIYDGTSDLDEHLHAFTTQVNLYYNDDAVLCKVFPISLKWSTSTWYKCLPLRSIDSFIALANRFGAQYETDLPHHTTSMKLIDLYQSNEKSL